MAPPRIENKGITLQLNRPRAHPLNVSPTPIATVQRRLDHFAASNHSSPSNGMDSLRRHGQAAKPASSDWLQTVKGMEEYVRTGQSLREMGEFALGEAEGGVKTLGATAKGIRALVLHPVQSAKQVSQAVMASGPALTEFSRNSGPIMADSVRRSAHQFANGSSRQSGNMMGVALTNTFLSLTPMPKVTTLVSGASKMLARSLPKADLAAKLRPIPRKLQSGRAGTLGGNRRGGGLPGGGNGAGPCPIRAAIENSELKTVQGAISGPAVMRYVDKLKEGHVAPPIKVADDVIVDGNHRYAAGRVFGQEPAQIRGAIAPSQAGNAIPFGQIYIDPTDWGNH